MEADQSGRGRRLHDREKRINDQQQQQQDDGSDSDSELLKNMASMVIFIYF